MIGDPTFSNKKILENLDFLENGGMSDKSLINKEQLFYGKDKGQWSPEKALKDKNIFIGTR